MANDVAIQFLKLTVRRLSNEIDFSYDRDATHRRELCGNLQHEAHKDAMEIIKFDIREKHQRDIESLESTIDLLENFI